MLDNFHHTHVDETHQPDLDAVKVISKEVKYSFIAATVFSNKVVDKTGNETLESKRSESFICECFSVWIKLVCFFV